MEHRLNIARQDDDDDDDYVDDHDYDDDDYVDYVDDHDYDDDMQVQDQLGQESSQLKVLENQRDYVQPPKCPKCLVKLFASVRIWQLLSPIYYTAGYICNRNAFLIKLIADADADAGVMYAEEV